MNSRKVALVLLALSLAGCGAVDRLTGQTDNTVLPGQREDAVPGKSQFPDGSDVATAPQPESSGEGAATEPLEPPAAADCPIGDPACAPSSDGTFSDPQ